jgi:hypothetical protein
VSRVVSHPDERAIGWRLRTPTNLRARPNAIAIRKLIDEIVQLNDKFGYDRDALVKMLDDALSRAKQGR